MTKKNSLIFSNTTKDVDYGGEEIVYPKSPVIQATVNTPFFIYALVICRIASKCVILEHDSGMLFFCLSYISYKLTIYFSFVVCIFFLIVLFFTCLLFWKRMYRSYAVDLNE